jgi:assimilatory nitrate reductase catalytic subunit
MAHDDPDRPFAETCKAHSRFIRRGKPGRCVEARPQRGWLRPCEHGAWAVLRVKITAAQVPGRIFAPIHWNNETAARARVGGVVSFRAAGLQGRSGGAGRPSRQIARRRQATYNDSARGIFRAALILDERLEAVVFFGREGEVPPWSGLAEVWRLERLDATARRFLLAGRTASTSFDASPTIYACFGAKSQAILSAIADGARSTEAIGAPLDAGANCGSCLPELRRMIAAARAPQKAKADLPA